MAVICLRDFMILLTTGWEFLNYLEQSRILFPARHCTLDLRLLSSSLLSNHIVLLNSTVLSQAVSRPGREFLSFLMVCILPGLSGFWSSIVSRCNFLWVLTDISGPPYILLLWVIFFSKTWSKFYRNLELSWNKLRKVEIRSARGLLILLFCGWVT